MFIQRPGFREFGRPFGSRFGGRFGMSGGAAAAPAVPASVTTYDWTGAANTSNGVAGQVGTASVGLLGWTPMRSNEWQVASGKAHSANNSFLADPIYLSTHLRLNDRIAIQGDQITSLNYTFGLGYNPTTGEGYFIRWNFGGTSAIGRMTSGGSYPATASFTLIESTSYAGGQTTDWAVLQRTVLGQTSIITFMVCPDLSGHPDYANPRTTITSYDTYIPLAQAGYPFVSSTIGNVGNLPRFEVTTLSTEFTMDKMFIGLGKTTDIALVGRRTQWAGYRNFTASAGLTINSVTVTDDTHVTLNVTTGAINARVTITEPNGATQIVQVCTYAVNESRAVYAAERGVSMKKYANYGSGASTVFTTTTGGTDPYGVMFSADGTYIYELAGGVNIHKYDVAGTLQNTFTFTGANNVRKGITLPNGKYVVSNYGAANYRLINADDSDGGQWNGSSSMASCFGLCLFYDQALGRNTVLTAGWADKNVRQWELDGTHIKIWATGFAGQISDVAVSSDGNRVYVADWTSNLILVYANNGTSLGTFAATVSAPHALCVLQDETLLVADETGTYHTIIQAYALDGSRMGQWNSAAVSQIVGLGVYPLPAPSPA